MQKSFGGLMGPCKALTGALRWKKLIGILNSSHLWDLPPPKGKKIGQPCGHICKWMITYMISEIISTHFYIPEPGTHAEKVLAGRWALDWSSEAEETVMLDGTFP